MQTHAKNSRDSQSKAVANRSAADKHAGGAAVMLADNSPQAANAARLQAMADGRPSSVAQMMGLEEMFGGAVQTEEQEPREGSEAQQPGGPESEGVAIGGGASPEPENGEQAGAAPAPAQAAETEGQAPAPASDNFSMMLGLAEKAAVPEPAVDQAPAQAPAEAAASGDSGGGSETEAPAPAERDSAFSMLAEKAGAAADLETVLADTSGGGEAAGESSPASAEGDPVFMALLARVEAIGAQERAHVPAEEASSAAQAAAVGPSNEVASMAEAVQVSAMDQQQPQPFDRAGFKKALMDKIAATAPKTLEQADQFKSGNKLSSIIGAVTGKVKEAKEKAQGPIEKTAKATPDTTGVTPKPITDLTPQDAGAAPADPGFADATPGPKSEAEVSASFQAGSQSLDQQMAEAKITEEQLANSNEPAFIAALGAKQGAQADAAQAPGLYRQQEQSMLASAKADATATVQAQTAAMHGDRAGLMDQVTASQTQSKTKDEQQRAKVASDIQTIYGKTKSDVEKRLSKLDTDVKNTFAKGANNAKKAFEGYVDGRMAAFKKARYSGFWGPAKWLKDKVWGMPSEVNSFYSQGRANYISQMDGVINNVVSIVETGLTEAKSIISQGKQQIQTYVTGLPQFLQTVGADTASDIQSKFAELESSVDAKQGELINTLAQKYNDSLKAVDADIDARKSANEGLVDKAINAVAGTIATLLQLKNMLMSTLAKAQSVVGLIIADPIGFLGNLVNSVQLDLNNFLAKIGMYLQQGLMEWLTGAIAATGIKMPDKFDLPGIFSLVMQVLGLTYDYIRSIAVKVLGERTVSALETTFEIFMILVKDGIDGLWKYIQGKIGDLKAMVMDKIKDILINQVIKAGIKWIISMLSPVGAPIKAAIAIYDIIMWITTKGKALIEFVNSVLDSVMAIAKGNIGGAAKLVESSLAKAVPILISFLASLLGLNTIPAKVQAILEKLRTPVRKAVTWILEKAKDFVKTMGSKLKDKVTGKKKGDGGKKKDAEEGDAGDTPKKLFTEAGERHALVGVPKGSKVALRVSSDPVLLDQFIANNKMDSNASGNTAYIQAVTVLETSHNAWKAMPRDTGGTTAKSDAYNGLAALIAAVFPHIGVSTVPPESQISYGTPTGATFAKWMDANPLTIYGDLGKDSNGAPGNATWEILRLRKRSESVSNACYVRGHLLNHNVHGPAQWRNPTPITGTTNKAHLDSVESDVKGWIKDGKILRYKVTVNYGRSFAFPSGKARLIETRLGAARYRNLVNAENQVPKSIKCEVWELDDNLDVGEKLTSETIPQKFPEPYKYFYPVGGNLTDLRKLSNKNTSVLSRPAAAVKKKRKKKRKERER